MKRLERGGILTRQVMATSPPTVEYALTDLGGEVTPRHRGYCPGRTQTQQ
ncbi:hypothetical protein COMA1_20627 [Candidatus Nitrospira nitrosa]|uniref:HTH hxlR-type domain-containing protein n=1 Tax=Candidatus Nitrospira nitrosa TaxID=1742972 RepID=A0A0S4LEM8_9BACT|nr:hypothetical protein COMA1_20627 [Candidatus Nitrospira nitrosa]